MDDEDDEDEDEDDEQPSHSRFKSERKEGMVVVRLSDGARRRRNIPDTLGKVDSYDMDKQKYSDFFFSFLFQLFCK